MFYSLAVSAARATARRQRLSVMVTVAVLVAAASGAPGCDIWENSAAPEAPETVEATAVPIDPVEATVRRLTRAQYDNAVLDLLGEGAPLPAALEPDAAIGGSLAVGASVAAVSAWGVEKYESSAYALAEWAMSNSTSRGMLVPCAPVATIDDTCAEAAVRHAGRRIWRRPLLDDEVTGLVGVAAQAAEALEDFHLGLGYAIGAMLQSPNFLYRIELGVEGEDGVRRYDAWEMATRLSFFLWNTTPDDALLDAAESGALDTAEGLAAQVDRLLASDRVRGAVRAFFTDMLQLHALEELSKDPAIFQHFSADLGPVAREETLRLIEHVVFEAEGDIRELMTTRRTFVDSLLASIYEVPMPEGEGFAEVTLPESSGRRGLLGHVSFLALQAHPVSSSATLRGKFVREQLLCETMPLPPSDVDTSLPEPSGTAPTLRDRVAEHLQNEACAVCHLLMDPIGLGLENFDGIGKWRDTEHDALIDASGDLDGTLFGDAWDLAEVIRDHPGFVGCVARRLYRHAAGHVETPGEAAALEALDGVFAGSGYRLLVLLRAIAISEAFRTAGEVVE